MERIVVENGIQNLECSIDGCPVDIEDQKHLLQCKPLLEKLILMTNLKNASYSDIFACVKKQKTITDVFIKLIDIRNKILDEKHRNS